MKTYSIQKYLAWCHISWCLIGFVKAKSEEEAYQKLGMEMFVYPNNYKTENMGMAGLSYGLLQLPEKDHKDQFILREMKQFSSKNKLIAYLAT